MGSPESRRVAELQKLRAELVKQLEQLDFRSDSIGQALAKMAQCAALPPDWAAAATEARRQRDAALEQKVVEGNPAFSI